MASNVNASAQVPLLCQLCNKDSGVQWRCCTCAELLCDSCKTVHARSKISQYHKIIRYEKVEISVDDKLLFCAVHQNSTLQFTCIDCQKLICLSCIEGLHKKHTFSNIEELVLNERKELFRCVSESKRKLALTQEAKKSLLDTKQQYSVDVNWNFDKIEKAKKELKSKIDSITEGMINKLHQKERTDQETFTGAEVLIDEDIDLLSQMVKIADNKLSEADIRDFPQYLDNFKQRIKPYPKCRFENELRTDLLDPKEIEHDVMRELVGNLDVKTNKQNLGQQPSSLTDFTVVSAFTSGCKVSLVEPVDGNHAWFAFYGEPGIYLITIQGKVVRAVKTDFRVFLIATSPSEDVFLSVFSGHKLKRLSANDRLEDICDVEPFYTQGLSITYQSDILVCLKKNFLGKVGRYSMNGQLLQSIEYGKDGKTPLFMEPVCLMQCSNGNICVKDYNRFQDTMSIVVVDKEGKYLFTYAGLLSDGSISKGFEPHEMAHDLRDNIYLTDKPNNAVHILDKNGKFLRFLLTGNTDLDLPVGICIDKLGQIWICNTGNNKILILK